MAHGVHSSYINVAPHWPSILPVTVQFATYFSIYNTSLCMVIPPTVAEGSSTTVMIYYIQYY